SYFLYVFGCVFIFFFFSSRRRHTRFDCDWSSDVCSSDLVRIPPSTCTEMRPRSRLATNVWCVSASPISQGEPACLIEVSGEAPRSEERRVGKECRSRWSP